MSRTKGTGNVDQCTPPEILAAVRNVFGGFIGFDPCTNPHSITDARHSFALPRYEGRFQDDSRIEYTDALREAWFAQGYINPPFGRSYNKRWAKKIAYEGRHNEQIALVPAVPGAQWFYPLWSAKAICFLKHRLIFLNVPINEKTGQVEPADFDCCTAYFGNHVERFIEEFRHMGVIANRLS